MSEVSKIEWCDSTFNPWIGCTKISPACDHCYAAAMMDTRRHVVQWGAGNPRKRTSDANWKLPLRWNAKTFTQCSACGWRGEWMTEGSLLCCPECGAGEHAIQPARRRVFCASLADWLDNEVPIEWLGDLLDLIRCTPRLHWLLLSKRIGNWRARLIEVVSRVTGWPENPREDLKQWLQDWLNGFPPVNVWIGATICNQAEADRDVPKLQAVPARVRFLSIEPMLGPIDLLTAGDALCRCEGCRRMAEQHPERAGLQRIDWVICGGESGPKSRPMHPDWVRSLRDQCAQASVPFLFKQWGEWLHDSQITEKNAGYPPPSFFDADGEPTGKRWHAWNAGDLLENVSMRIGKKAAGRMLDGVEHNEVPNG